MSILDLIIRLKNAAMRNYDVCKVIYTKYALSVIIKMQEAGLLVSYRLIEADKKSKTSSYVEKYIEVVMRRLTKTQKPLMLYVTGTSTPSKPLYFSHKKISNLVKGHLFNKIFIFSTSGGIMTAQEATKNRMGGKSLFYVEVLQG